MSRPLTPAYRRFLEEWPQLSKEYDQKAADRVGISLRHYRRWKKELCDADPFDDRKVLYQEMAYRLTQPPGEFRDQIDLRIAVLRWRIGLEDGTPHPPLDLDTWVF